MMSMTLNTAAQVSDTYSQINSLQAVIDNLQAALSAKTPVSISSISFFDIIAGVSFDEGVIGPADAAVVIQTLLGAMNAKMAVMMTTLAAYP